ncbi:unnamed protein product [Malus baccata var. baccata]
MVPEHDLEGGYVMYGPRINTIGSSPFRIAIVQNMQRLGVIKRLMPDVDEGRGPRLRALKKLPPLVNYGSCEIRSSSSPRSHSDREFEGADDLSHHHHDQDTLPQAPAQDIATLFHMVLMEVLDRVWEDLVMEEGPEQMPQALQVQSLEALPPPLRYCTGSRDITSSCCSDRCTICLEDYMDGESCRVFACKHMFHSNCIDHWLKNHLTCPVCRNSVVDI